MVGMKISDVRSKTDAELHQEITALKKERMNLRFSRAASVKVNQGRFKAIKRSIAKILTVLNERKLLSVDNA